MKKKFENLNPRILYLILLVFSSCNSIKKITDGYVEYQFNFSNKINQSNISILKNKVSKSNNSNYSLSFYPDSVRVDDIEGKRIFIPKEHKKIINRKNWGEEHFEIINSKEVYDAGEVLYEIIINKKDKIKVKGTTGYKVEIKETFTNRNNDVLKENIELYISDKYKFPLNYYDFLRLKKGIDINGLILKARIYKPNTTGLFHEFLLKEFNREKQNKDLIKLESIKNLNFKY
ncbi:MAG: hypothetical protein CMB99_08390 [Flavobacteriaceae bacterium]|nr:hypothetical protein [Flavobacteriaceae bacterium]|tara:strand:+ start:73929 stop:74624 length:696 start_codon:yes stop_codon:yes gene_type:complete